MPDASSRTLTASATRLRRLLTAFVAATAVLLVLERLGYAGAYRGGSLSGVAARAGEQFVYALPGFLYLLALWQLRQAVAAVAEGALFGPAVVAAVKRVGALIIAGAAASILLMPALHRLFGDAYPRLIDYDVATLILAAIGAALTFIARLIERAAAVQSELDQIF
jgi:hypothetical protein